MEKSIQEIEDIIATIEQELVTSEVPAAIIKLFIELKSRIAKLRDAGKTREDKKPSNGQQEEDREIIPFGNDRLLDSDYQGSPALISFNNC